MEILLCFLIIIYVVIGRNILTDIAPDLPFVLYLLIVYGVPFAISFLYVNQKKRDKIARQEVALRREQTLKELEARFDTNSYTQAEMEHLIYTADLTTGQKDALRRKYALPKSRQQPSD